MKLFSLIPVVFTAILLLGCTAITMTHYISPAASGARTWREHQVQDVGLDLGGPANSLQLDTHGLRFHVSCRNKGYTGLLSGPLLFPVIPIVLLGPLVREPLETDPLEIHLDLEPIGEPVGDPFAFTPGRVELRDNDDRRMRLEEIHVTRWVGRSWERTKLPTDDTISVKGPTPLVFLFEVPSESRGSRFRLSLDGLTQSGTSIALPTIELRAASGFVLEMGP
jgi:hypothetical protein